MAPDKFKRKLTAILSTQKKSPESFSLRLERLALAGIAASLFVGVGFGICQYHFREETFRTGMVAKEIRCKLSDVVVRSPNRTDALFACKAAQDAIGFLESHGLDVTGGIEIDLLQRLPAVVSSSAAGCYLESERRVLVLVFPEFKKFKTWFGIPIDHDLYRSLISHEVAHIVAGFNFKIPTPSIQAKEYIAYVTQFAVMEPVLRDRVLSHFQGGAFEGDWQMGTTIYMFDCMGFGVRAYRHFSKLANGRNYLHAILNGEALVE
jgi:hypothetical protein